MNGRRADGKRPHTAAGCRGRVFSTLIMGPQNLGIYCPTESLVSGGYASGRTDRWLGTAFFDMNSYSRSPVLYMGQCAFNVISCSSRTGTGGLLILPGRR